MTRFHKICLDSVQYAHRRYMQEMIARYSMNVVLHYIAFHSSGFEMELDSVIEECLLSTISTSSCCYEYAHSRIKTNTLKIIERYDWCGDDREMLLGLLTSITDHVSSLMSIDSDLSSLYKTEISCFYDDDSVYIITPGNNSNTDCGLFLYNMIMDVSGVESFEYYNNTDRPENISLNEWNERLDKWEEVTTSYYHKCSFDNSITISSTNVNIFNSKPRNYKMCKQHELYHETKDYLTLMYSEYKGALRSTLHMLIHDQIQVSATKVNATNWLNAYEYILRQRAAFIINNPKVCDKFKEKCDEMFIPLFQYFNLVDDKAIMAYNASEWLHK